MKRLPGSSSDGSASSAILSTATQVAIQALTLFVAYRIGVILFGLPVLGVWSIASASATFGRIGDLGFAGAVPRLVAGHHSAGTHGQIPALIETAVLATALGTLILALLAFYPLLAFVRSVTTAETSALVMPLLIGANLALVGGGIGSALLGCLDGIGEFRTRALISVLGAVANPLTIYLCGKTLGPFSLAVGAIVQVTLMMTLGWLALRGRIPGLSALPQQWSPVAFRTLFRIGKFTQANSVLIMLFEPASRMLAGRFGGLEFAATFDLAAKVAGNLRLLFSSFAQSLVPFHAYLKNRPDEARRLFASSTLLTATVASVVSAVALAMAPLLSMFSLTRIDPGFVGSFWLLLLGNLVNVIGGPGYSYLVGGGAIAVATRALGLQALVFITVAVTMELLSIDVGVSMAYAAAVGVSGLYLLALASRHLAIPPDEVITRALVAAAPAIATLAVLAFLALAGFLAQWQAMASLVPLIGIVLAATVTLLNLRVSRRCIADILMFRMKAASPST